MPDFPMAVPSCPTLDWRRWPPHSRNARKEDIEAQRARAGTEGTRPETQAAAQHRYDLECAVRVPRSGLLCWFARVVYSTLPS